VSFLTYIAVLNAGILAVSLFKRWRGIVWLSFVGTILLLIGWMMGLIHRSALDVLLIHHDLLPAL